MMNRPNHVVSAALTILVLGLTACSALSTKRSDAGVHTMAMMVGEVTDSSALVQVRLTARDPLVQGDLPSDISGDISGDIPGAAGVVRFVLEPEESKLDKHDRMQIVAARADRDYIARASWTGLPSGMHFTCTAWVGVDEKHLAPGPRVTFRTLPGAAAATPVRFVVVTGMNYAKFHGDARIDRAQHIVENNTALPPAYVGPDKKLGYPALATILGMNPDFFVGTGDNVYYDTPDNPRARTITEMRRKWHEQFVQPRYTDLFERVPTYWMIDDHDYRIDDGDNSGAYLPTSAMGRRMMLEQLPVAPADDDDALTYRTHRVSKDVQIWLPEGRMYRSPNALPDGPDKSIWGPKQRAWLEASLAASDATFKLLISPTPLIGPDDLRKKDNHTDIGGFQYERDAFFAWLKQSGVAQRGFYIICGDRHWQYHSVHPTGIEEFSCGALVDANSRPARRAGDPKSTDPEGLIKQPYVQDPPSGGFLLVEVKPAEGDAPATLVFTFHDERGVVLYRHEKKERK